MEDRYYELNQKVVRKEVELELMQKKVQDYEEKLNNTQPPIPVPESKVKLQESSNIDLLISPLKVWHIHVYNI